MKDKSLQIIYRTGPWSWTMGSFKGIRISGWSEIHPQLSGKTAYQGGIVRPSKQRISMQKRTGRKVIYEYRIV